MKIAEKNLMDLTYELVYFKTGEERAELVARGDGKHEELGEIYIPRWYHKGKVSFMPVGKTGAIKIKSLWNGEDKLKAREDVRNFGTRLYSERRPA